jgi:prepilin-type N-terminal cleavage/methylation domain-containing protein
MKINDTLLPAWSIGTIRSTAKAFTLIELLIVVAIIAVLAAIALPNFLEAQTRSKTARVKSDLRTLATAIESYGVDNSEYPPAPVALGPRFHNFIPLTTPVSYISAIPIDPFKPEENHGHRRWRTGMYSYGAMPLSHARRWLLLSNGPDRVANVERKDVLFYPGPDVEDDLIAYDATNGTLSIGDLFRSNDGLLTE